MAAVPAATLEGSILEAARIGDRDTVVAWLDSPGADVNAVGHDGLSLLMAVAWRYGAHGLPTRDAEASLEVARELLRWAGYRRTPRKEVLRLRSLVLRGRARPHRANDAIMKTIFRLPNELAWKVLGFWRATSDITGEVI